MKYLQMRQLQIPEPGLCLAQLILNLKSFLTTLWDKSLVLVYSLSYNTAFEHENPNIFYSHLHNILFSFHLPCTE